MWKKLFVPRSGQSSPYPLATSEAIRRRPSLPHFAAGQAGGSLPLRLPLRRRESGGTPVLRLRLVRCRLGVSALLAASRTVAVLLVFWAWSSPSLPRSGLVVGEVVEVFRRAQFSVCAPLAGCGSEGRSRRWSVFRFWWFCRWGSSSSAFLLRSASVARGAASAGAWAMRLVGLDGVASAGRRVELGGG